MTAFPLTNAPSTISGLVGWMDAADTSTSNITSSGGLVSNIRNKANSQNPFVQATGGNQPQTGVSTIAGKNVLRFNGTSNYLSCNALASAFTGTDAAVSVFAVYKPIGLTLSPTIFCAANSANTTVLFTHSNSTNNLFRIQKNDDSSASVSATATTAPTLVPVMFSMSCAGTTLKAWKDEASFYNGAFNVGATTVNTFALGVRPTSAISNYFNGDIAEIIVYNRDLSDAEVTQVNRYLGNKWGIVSL